MRGIALPALLAASLAYTASANDKPVLKVSLYTPLLPHLFSHTPPKGYGNQSTLFRTVRRRLGRQVDTL